MNTLPCDVQRCTGDKCELKQYCARYTAPVKDCYRAVMGDSKHCISQGGIEFISNGKLDKKELRR